MSTPQIPDETRRQELAEEGKTAIRTLVDGMDMPHVVEQLRGLEQFQSELIEKCPWTPAAFNRKNR